ncbi:expressed unknown protein [Seminavis robusta]|uniref:Uncharacterized protein n=1 Tax=Seminavis robusta TaxID=568900 RepID=A0A9N8HH07_9STRA|nr:expressed unknown protein [Seminavis robusta]|eukprot:Sro672_g185150.1 n/a (200) ;mRNA; f:52088-52687
MSEIPIEVASSVVASPDTTKSSINEETMIDALELCITGKRIPYNNTVESDVHDVLDRATVTPTSEIEMEGIDTNIIASEVCRRILLHKLSDTQCELLKAAITVSGRNTFTKEAVDQVMDEVNMEIQDTPISKKRKRDDSFFDTMNSTCILKEAAKRLLQDNVKPGDGDVVSYAVAFWNNFFRPRLVSPLRRALPAVKEE